MIEIYLLVASIFLLALLIVFLPFRLTWKGRGIVLISGAGIGCLAYFGIDTLSYRVIFPSIIILSALLSYVVMKNMEIIKSSHRQKKNLDQGIEPLFSYAELKEKAQYAETIDQYYSNADQLVNVDEMQSMAKETEEASSYLQDQTEIDQLIKQQLSEVAVTEDSHVKETVFNHPEINASLDNLEDENRLGLFSQVEPFLEEHQDEQVSEDLYEPEPLDSANRLDNEHPSELPTLDIYEIGNQLEEIDFSQRAIAADKFEKRAAETLTEFDLSSDEKDFIEVRKQLFANLNEDTIVNGDPKKTDHQDPLNEGESVNSEVEEPANNNGKVKADVQQTAFDSNQAKPNLEQTARGQVNRNAQQTGAAILFSSPELETAFDDLEELYLKKKASEKKKEEHE